MNNSQKLLQIRNKKLGLIITDARTAKRRSIEECAEAVGVTVEKFQEYEKGNTAPSLPQLELFALFLNLPIEHFWGKTTLTEASTSTQLQEKERLLNLRNRVIGANLRMTRELASLSLQEMSEKSGISEEQITRYELGQDVLSITELELLTSLIGIPLEQFYDEHGPVGKWRSQQNTLRKFQELPPELQQFISMPVNRPYLDLAMRLSELSAEKLRAVAEVLLEITY